jgi:DNA-binding FadR family transcriptional regulator
MERARADSHPASGSLREPERGTERLSLEPIRSVQMYEQLCDRIVEAIRTGRWAPGDQLPPERELAKALGVSRPSLREALTALQLRGVLEMRQGSRTSVAPNAIEIVAHSPPANLFGVDADVSPVALLEARLTVEPRIAALAAQGWEDDPEVDRLLELMDGARDWENPSHRAIWSDADRLFHRQLAAHTTNPVLLSFAEHMALVQGQPLWRRLRDEMLAVPDRIEASIGEHVRIYGAIKGGDAAGAAGAAETHVAVVREYMGLEEVTK